MPSAQVSLVIETEKKAAQMELDARTKAQGILDAAKMTAAENRLGINKAADAKIETNGSAAREQSNTIVKESDAAASQMAANLRETANRHRGIAVQAAVDVLTGRS